MENSQNLESLNNQGQSSSVYGKWMWWMMCVLAKITAVEQVARNKLQIFIITFFFPFNPFNLHLRSASLKPLTTWYY